MQATYNDYVSALGGLLDADNRTMLERSPDLQAAAAKSHQSVRDMTETYWITFLDLTVRREPAKALAFTERFNEMIARDAKGLEDGEHGAGTKYLAIVDYERDRLANEHHTNPAAQKMRLGIVSEPEPQPARANSQMGMGELAARTAVRATVWTLVRDVIRAVLK